MQKLWEYKDLDGVGDLQDRETVESSGHGDSFDGEII